VVIYFAVEFYSPVPLMTTIVSNDDRSMIVESDDIEGENHDILLIFIKQSLTFSDLPLNFGNIINEVRPYKKVTS
jgi:hypothetical protein